MESQSGLIKRIEAQDLITRFRSKEDLFRYLTQQSKTQALRQFIGIVNLFLQSLNVTKIGFLRAILKEEKKSLLINEINFMEVPNYHDISVKNQYDDGMEDEEVEIYLPIKQYLSNKLPELEFQEQSNLIIFQKLFKKLIRKGFQFLLKTQRSKEFSQVIHGQKNLRSILISQVRFSYQCFRKNLELEFFMKEHAKVYRSRKSQQSQSIIKKLSEKRPSPEEMNIDAGNGLKRREVIQQEQQEEVKVSMRNSFFQNKLY